MGELESLALRFVVLILGTLSQLIKIVFLAGEGLSLLEAPSTGMPLKTIPEGRSPHLKRFRVIDAVSSSLRTFQECLTEELSILATLGPKKCK